MLVVKGHRLQREDPFARVIHRLDPVLITGRGYDCTKTTVAINDHANPSGDGLSANSGDKCRCLILLHSNADRAGFVGTIAKTADIDIVTAGGEKIPGLKAQCDVAVTGGVEAERL